MDRVFVVTAIEWAGDWMLRAQVGEADVHGPSGGQQWKAPQKVLTLDELMALIETPDTVVTSRTRSGTCGPNLYVRTGPNGARTIEAVPIPQVQQDLRDIASLIK